MNNTEAEVAQNAPAVVFIVMGILSGIPVVVNITYIIIFVKKLRKKLHNLLVLSLCIGDTFLGISCVMHTLSQLNSYIRVNVEICLWQTFGVSYGLVSTYIIILAICLERNAVVKARNFGMKEQLDRFKYLIISEPLAGGFLFTIETVRFTPHQETITDCTLPNLYGEQYNFFLTFIAGGLTLIAIMIVYVTLSTSYHIWKIFYARKQCHSSNIVVPYHSIDTTRGTDIEIIEDEITVGAKIDHLMSVNATGADMDSFEDEIACEADIESPREETTFVVDIENLSDIYAYGDDIENSKNEMTFRIKRENLEDEIAVEQNAENLKAKASIGVCISPIHTNEKNRRSGNDIKTVECSKTSNCPTCKHTTRVACSENSCTNRSNSKVNDVIMIMRTERKKIQRKSFITKDKMNNRAEGKRFQFESWEFRAFVTSIIIALTTAIFTGPILIVFWIEYYSGIIVPPEAKFIASASFILNSILNPFIYAWRIPEIKEEFQKLFRCCK